MRVLLVISSLSGGGAERVMTTMAAYWAEKGIDVTLLTLFPAETDFYQLHPKVTRVVLNQAKPSKNIIEGVLNNIRRIKGLRDAFNAIQADCIISFLEGTNILVLLANFRLQTPVIVSERNDPRKTTIGRVREGLRRLLYPGADVVVLQTPSVAGWVAQVMPKAKTVVIPNPVRVPAENNSLDSSNQGETLVAMGRLSYEKGFDLLIQAFSQAVKNNPGWQLLIMGDGPLRAELEAQVSQLGLPEKVQFLGRIKTPDTVLQAADIFVLSSRTEGFPNALIEAMACGLPVVSFDCPSGPADIIEHEVNGLLVEEGNVKQLAITIQRLMDDPELAAAIGCQAVQVIEKFSIDAVMSQWTALLPSTKNDNGLLNDNK